MHLTTTRLPYLYMCLLHDCCMTNCTGLHLTIQLTATQRLAQVFNTEAAQGLTPYLLCHQVSC